MDEQMNRRRTRLTAWLERHQGPPVLAVIALAGGLLTLAVSWPTGPSRETGGRVESLRFPEVIYFSSPVRGQVRLADGRETSVALPQIGCRVGDTVAVVELPKLWGSEFRAGISGCQRDGTRVGIPRQSARR
jgi:hypothetical protein